ncbi:transporter [Thiomicrorhabdus xiamenensis]|uniref:Transporter n=2 Tax=Thiomicrorhabdus xiamenensis TaxID=2739063 RepID=A0A7D4TGN1_9GAMM|nr:transporter [Thiomicrorhabdus xiamenensis]
MSMNVFSSRALLVAMGLAPVSAMASGFALIEQSASGQGLSYAGAAANAEDASIMWFNPAGLTRFEGDQLIIGGHVISPKADFTEQASVKNGATPIGGEGDNGATVGFVPNVYWKSRLGAYDVGFGVNVPFGQHISYDEDWVGRYHATETDLKTLNLNPAIAGKVNDQLSFGFGLNAQYVDVILEQKVDQSFIGDSDGNAKVSGNSWAFGYNLGLLYQADEDLDIGFSYRSKMQHDVEGKIDYSDINAALGGVLYDMDASSNVVLPASASLAMNYRLSEHTRLLASATWTGWSGYDELIIELEDGSSSESNQNFEDSMRYAVGMIHQFNRQLKLRGGLAIDYTPVPDKYSRSPRTPDSNRKWVSVGLGYQLNKRMNLDVGYSHLFANRSDVDYNVTTSLGSYDLRGYYDSAVDILSAQLVWNF